LSRSFDRAHALAERGFVRKLGGFFDDVTRSIDKRLKAAGTTNVSASKLFDPADFRIAFAKAITPHIARGLSAGITFERDWIRKSGLSSQQAFAPLIAQREELPLPPSFQVDLTEEQLAALKKFLKARQVGLWSSVGKTTSLQLRQAIAAGLKDGDNIKQLTERVNKRMRTYKGWQAKRVARTETTGAMNAAAQIERDEIGIKKKEWVTTLDERARASHVAVDGQTRLNANAYSVGGAALMHPADASLGAPASETVNCRCVSVASFDDS